MFLILIALNCCFNHFFHILFCLIFVQSDGRVRRAVARGARARLRATGRDPVAVGETGMLTDLEHHIYPLFAGQRPRQEVPSIRLSPSEKRELFTLLLIFQRYMRSPSTFGSLVCFSTRNPRITSTTGSI